MGDNATAYPLQWPLGWKRTRWRKKSRFKVASFGQSRDGLLKQLKLMGGMRIVLSTNVPLRRDGLPYSKTPCIEDPGVAVYWYDFKKDASRCMACDVWNKVSDNARAIEKSIEALRGLERWGTSDIVERAFDGFNALPPHSDVESVSCWRDVLGVGAAGSYEEARVGFVKKCQEFHPDKGGDELMMIRLNAAWDEAKVFYGRT